MYAQTVIHEHAAEVGVPGWTKPDSNRQPAACKTAALPIGAIGPCGESRYEVFRNPVHQQPAAERRISERRTHPRRLRSPVAQAAQRRTGLLRTVRDTASQESAG